MKQDWLKQANKIRSIIIKLMITSSKEKNVKSDQKKQERYNIKWKKKEITLNLFKTMKAKRLE